MYFFLNKALWQGEIGEAESRRIQVLSTSAWLWFAHFGRGSARPWLWCDSRARRSRSRGICDPPRFYAVYDLQGDGECPESWRGGRSFQVARSSRKALHYEGWFICSMQVVLLLVWRRKLLHFILSLNKFIFIFFFSPSRSCRRTKPITAWSTCRSTRIKLVRLLLTISITSNILTSYTSLKILCSFEFVLRWIFIHSLFGKIHQSLIANYILEFNYNFVYC